MTNLPRRVLVVGFGRADRDPWYSKLDPLPLPKPGLLDSTPLLAPEPHDERWEALIDCATEVNAKLRAEADFNGGVLLSAAFIVVNGEQPVTVDAIIAAYRKRMQELRHG